MSNGYKTRLTGTAALSRRIRDLEAANASLRTAARVKNSTINGGDGLTVLDSSGNVIATIGHNSAGQRGVSFATPAGVNLLDLHPSPDDPTRGILVLNDNSGAIAFSADSNGGDGTGIFWPFIPAAFAGMTIAQWPFNTSGTFTTVSQTSTEHFSQGIVVQARVICDSGATAGQARLMVDGVQVGTTAAVTASASTATFRGLAGGVIRSDAFLEVQTRVTTGTGNCRAQVYGATWVPFDVI